MDENSTSSADEKPNVTKSRGPAYPYIDLGKALERVDQIVSKGLSTKQAVPPSTIYGYWGLGLKSSGSRQTLAALKYYGLIEYTGAGKDRRVKLTDSAMILAHDKEAGSSRRQITLKNVALAPDVFREVYEHEGGPHLPPDEAMILNLTLDKGFDRSSAEKAVRNFRSTIQLAGLDQPGVLSESEAKLEEIGSDSAIADDVEPGPSPRLNSAQQSRSNISGDNMAVSEGMKRDTFATLEGDVSLVWPISLSSDSLEDVETWTTLILKKIKREIQRREEEESAEALSD